MAISTFYREAKGAKINAPEYGYFVLPIFEAAWACNAEAIKLFVNAKAKVKGKSSNGSPLLQINILCFTHQQHHYAEYCGFVVITITADTALRLSRYFGLSERFWLNLQARYDLEVEKDRLECRLEKEVKVFADTSALQVHG
jgi:hypothetical protein